MVMPLLVLSWIIVGIGCWIGYQLIRQHGRILLRFESLEQQPTELNLRRPPSASVVPPQILLSSTRHPDNHDCAPRAFAPKCHTVASAALLCAIPATFAIQPWEQGIRPAKERLHKLEDALSINKWSHYSEYLTATDADRLHAEQTVLLKEKKLVEQSIQLSKTISEMPNVRYLMPNGS
jgi:hypothetical protein